MLQLILYPANKIFSWWTYIVTVTRKVMGERPLSDARVFSRGWLRSPLKMELLAGRPLACEQALCLEKKIGLDQRPVHRLAGR